MCKKGLIIKSYWADKILDGSKTIEIRGSNTKNIGDIEIIKSGTGLIYGKCKLYKTEPLNKERYQILKKKHCVELSWKELCNVYKKPYAWFLSDIIKYKTPKPYKHKQGCVIWVNL